MNTDNTIQQVIQQDAEAYAIDQSGVCSKTKHAHGCHCGAYIGGYEEGVKVTLSGKYSNAPADIEERFSDWYDKASDGWDAGAALPGERILEWFRQNTISNPSRYGIQDLSMEQVEKIWEAAREGNDEGGDYAYQSLQQWAQTEQGKSLLEGIKEPWVSVNERLPEIDTADKWNEQMGQSIEVWTHSDFGMRQGRYFHKGAHWSVNGVTSSNGIKVTHWHLLPSPPINK